MEAGPAAPLGPCVSAALPDVLTAALRQPLSQIHAATLLPDSLLVGIGEITHVRCFKLLNFEIFYYIAVDN